MRVLPAVALDSNGAKTVIGASGSPAPPIVNPG